MNNTMNFKSETQLECPFCDEGTMKEDSCGCLTCRKCHRVEGTNCNIKACQRARFSTQRSGESNNVSSKMC